jgi:catechol 2,3-dioxygenase-like lactoylglutathione lyase family enzyme
MSGAGSDWQLTGLHHICLTVSDLDRSVEFYRDLLGMTFVGQRETEADYVSQQTGYPGLRLAVASFTINPTSEEIINLVQYMTQSGQPSDQATNRPGNSHVCAFVDDIDAAYRELRAKGVSFQSEPVAITSGPNEGGFVVYLHDPDGYTIELFQPPAPQV